MNNQQTEECNVVAVNETVRGFQSWVPREAIQFAATDLQADSTMVGRNLSERVVADRYLDIDEHGYPEMFTWYAQVPVSVANPFSGIVQWQSPSGSPPGFDADPDWFGVSAIYDSSLSVGTRSDMLRQKLLFGDFDAKNLLVQELLRSDTTDYGWQDELVLLAEGQQFYEPELREALASRLVTIANEHVFERAGHAEVASSAIRTAASMMAVEKLEDYFLPLLRTPVAFDIRPQVFKAITRMFEFAPPQNSPVGLTTRIAELAEKFVERELMVAGKNSVFGQNAILALASLVDDRAIELCDKLKGIGVTWYNKRLGKSMRQLVSRWTECKVEAKSVAIPSQAHSILIQTQ